VSQKRSLETVQLQTFIRECPGDLVTPVSAYLRLQNAGARFLLESVEGGERASRYSFLGLGARARLWSDERGTWCRPRGEVAHLIADPQVDPLAAMVDFAGRHQCSRDTRSPQFLGGLVGYVSYDYVRRLERLGAPPAGEALPELMFELVDELIIFDHALHRVFLGVLRESSHAKRVASRFDEIESLLRSGLPVTSPKFTSPTFRPLMTASQYQDGVKKLQEHIRAGDIFQAVLSMEVEVQNAPPMFDIYRALRRINPSPYMYHLDFGDITLSGSSPESAVRMVQNRASMRPIAGTRPRGATEELDSQLERELRSSRKELAEHAMLVDLARNDLSRVAVPGSVKVSNYAHVERFSHVMHLVSDVEGELSAEAGAPDLLRATFPAGTVSGAPKIRAMQLIDEIETTRRNLYAGCMGYIGLDRTMDMALTIRSVVRAGDRTTLRAGAGIVAGSTPEGELAECNAKLAALVAAIKETASSATESHRAQNEYNAIRPHSAISERIES
jgi:anthranilate synthase component I